jgi:hypothetical protein
MKIVLNYKKPAFWAVAVTVIIVAAVAAGLASNQNLKATEIPANAKASSSTASGGKTGSSSEAADSTASSSNAMTGSGSSLVSSSASKASSAAGASSVVYKSTQYGFLLNLPDSWKGYTIVSGKWDGMAADGSSEKAVETGPIISVRNPKWTSKNPYQDIPVMVFTLKQWGLVQKEKIVIGAAPIGPKELGRNSKYVFALPARYNYAFLTGYEEVEKILDSNSLHTFEISK